MPSAKRTIRNLLKLAGEGNPNKNEREAAKIKAFALAAKHGIDISTISGERLISDDPIRMEYLMDSIAKWRPILANEIAKYAGVRVITHGGRGANQTITVIGRKGDLNLWKILFDRSQPEIDAAGKNWVASGHPGKSEGDTFRKNAAWGFGARLAEYAKECSKSENGRINAILLGERKECFALVMVGRDLAVKRETERIFPTLVAGPAVRLTGSSDARTSGYAFGKGMGVHKANIGG